MRRVVLSDSDAGIAITTSSRRFLRCLGQTWAAFRRCETASRAMAVLRAGALFISENARGDASFGERRAKLLRRRGYDAADMVTTRTAQQPSWRADLPAVFRPL